MLWYTDLETLRELYEPFMLFFRLQADPRTIELSMVSAVTIPGGTGAGDSRIGAARQFSP